MDYGCSKAIPETDYRQPAWTEQRLSRGFDDTELWSLDQVFARFVVPRLEAFKDRLVSHPARISPEQWDENVQAMIDGFKEVLRRDEWPNDFDVAKINKGLALFAEYYLDLWD